MKKFNTLIEELPKILQIQKISSINDCYSSIYGFKEYEISSKNGCALVLYPDGKYFVNFKEIEVRFFDNEHSFAEIQGDFVIIYGFKNIFLDKKDIRDM